MNFDIFIGEDRTELRAIDKAKLNLRYATEDGAIRPQQMRGGTILGNHGLEVGVHADAKVVYILDNGKILEKQGTVTVTEDSISF